MSTLSISFLKNALEKLFKNKGNLIFAFSSPMTGALPYSLAVVDRRFKNGRIYLRKLEDSLLTFDSNGKPLLNALEHPLDELLIANLLSQKRGLLMHACGVVYKRKGFLFAGISGAGKSTTARLWQKTKQAKILNDDRIIIRKRNSRFWIYGTPWHGDAGVYSTASAPLEKIFFLKKSSSNHLRRLDPLEAVSRLLVCAFPTFWDKQGMKYSLSFCQDLAQNCAALEFGFLPHESAVKFLTNNL